MAHSFLFRVCYVIYSSLSGVPLERVNVEEDMKIISNYLLAQMAALALFSSASMAAEPTKKQLERATDGKQHAGTTIEQAGDTHFNQALTLLRAGDEVGALAAFSRVLQMTPDHAQARAAREKLASELGLAELDKAARVMEDFAYSQCGPGHLWKVELREVYRFRPNQPPLAINAALLDLRQTPQAFVQLIVTPGEYEVRIMVERPVAGVARTTLSQASIETIPAQPDKLMKLLNRMLATGNLVKVGNQLHYSKNGS